MKNNLSKLDQAKQFLAELLDETLCWSCTDTQEKLAQELEEILGEFIPDWIKKNEE